MFITATVVTVILAGLLAFSAVRKLGRDPQVVATYTRVGVPESRLPVLAALLLAGAAGALTGLVWAPLGIAACAALIVYFALAVAAHLRARDAGHLGPPALLLLLSAAAFGLRLLTW